MNVDKIVNLTPHAVTLWGPDRQSYDLPSRGLARVETRSEVVGTLAPTGVEVVRVEYGELTGVPEPREGVCYLVSLVCLQANATARDRGLPSRGDLVCPATGPNDGALRDAQGRVTGVTRLQVL